MENNDNNGENMAVVEKTETAVVTPKPNRLAERLRGRDKYKEKEYQNEEDAIDDVLELLDELESNSKEAETFKQGMMSLISENPMLAYILKEAKENKNLIASIQALYDSPEEMMIKEGDEGYDAVQSKIKGRIERETADKEIYSKWDEAMKKFPETFKTWADAKNIPPEERDVFADFLADTMIKLVSGDIDEITLNRMWESFKYKEDIAALEEDLGISNENNTTEAVAENKAPIIPLPEGNVAKPAQEAPPRKLNPMEELRQSGYYE